LKIEILINLPFLGIERTMRGVVVNDNIKMDIREKGCEILDWIQLALDRVQWRAVVNTVMNLLVPLQGG
jgi:hypothetical protein